MNNVEFGKYLRGKRKERKLTIRQLDTYSGVSHSYISQIERGNRGIPSPDILKKLSKPLGVDYEELMVKAGHIDLLKSDLDGDLANIIDENFVDMVNTMIEELFSGDKLTLEDYEKVGLSEESPSLYEYVKSLSFAEKVEFIKDSMIDDDHKSLNSFQKQFNFITGRKEKMILDLSDDSIVDKLLMTYEGMELTNEEKLEFLAIARGIFSARRALKEKN